MTAWRWRRFLLNIFDIIADIHAHIDLFCGGTFVYPGADFVHFVGLAATFWSCFW
jgi:hypothetical protein